MKVATFGRNLGGCDRRSWIVNRELRGAAGRRCGSHRKRRAWISILKDMPEMREGGKRFRVERNFEASKWKLESGRR